MANSQAHREARITIDLLPHRVVLEQMRSHERLSEPYLIEVYVVCEDGEVDFLPFLGRPVGIEVRDDDEVMLRHFHGLLFEAAFVGWDTSGYRYRLILKPWLHLLRQNLTYRIFQDRTAVEVIKEVFDASRVSDVDYSRLSGSFRKRKYCVQYRESDFDFASRLMEEEGIYYYFEHKHDRHVMMLCNAPGSRVYCDQRQLKFLPPSETRPNDRDLVLVWEEQVSSTAQQVVRLRTFDYQEPQRPRDVTAVGAHAHDRDAVEYYDYPASGYIAPEATRQAEVLGEAQHAGRRIFRGEATGAQLACGRLFDLAGHNNGRFNEAYLVTALSYGVISENYRSVAGDREPLAQTIDLEAVPADVRWRAPWKTPKPVARGPETAIVTCPPGEEIHTDKWGRVKVRFHWDLTNPTDDKSSCWLRVSHNSAGAGFGNVILPRANQEVIVDFLDGDPDRP
ncbi:MAG: type VI secretion system tip protein VgrG, partial [Caulobacteraceae bacterium]|nr:type VI secretion system tip protein VgrG [Caulobacteraceae bacterium]